MFSPVQKLVIAFLILEVLFVTIVVLASFLFKLFLSLKAQLDKKKLTDIEYYLTHSDNQSAPPHLSHPGLVLLALNNAVTLNQQKKSRIVSTYLIQKLRTYSYSRNWIKRYYLLQAFKFYICDEDKDRIISLINSLRPVLCLNAIKCCSPIMDRDIFDVIIIKLKTLDKPEQAIYIQQLNRNDVLINLLNEKLNATHDTNVSVLCYRIIGHIGYDKCFFDKALQDSFSNNGQLKLAAIPVMSHAKPQKALPRLNQLLLNESWLIRLKTLQSLGDIHQPESLEAIEKCLKDDNSWVRTNAIKTLLKFGGKGESILKKNHAFDNAFESSAAIYFEDL